MTYELHEESSFLFVRILSIYPRHYPVRRAMLHSKCTMQSPMTMQISRLCACPASEQQPLHSIDYSPSHSDVFQPCKGLIVINLSFVLTAHWLWLHHPSSHSQNPLSERIMQSFCVDSTRPKGFMNPSGMKWSYLCTGSFHIPTYKRPTIKLDFCTLIHLLPNLRLYSSCLPSPPTNLNSNACLQQHHYQQQQDNAKDKAVLAMTKK